MELPPYRLDHWLAEFEFLQPPIPYDLAASTGPTWTLRELLALGTEPLSLDDTALSYAPPDGARALRGCIAAYYGIDPDWVVTTTGASEAISILFCLAAQPGRHILLPFPAYPAFETLAKAWGLLPKRYQLNRSDNYHLDVAGLIEQTDRNTGLVLVNTPFNPPGSVVPSTDVGWLATQLADRGIPLIVDEVYHPVYFGNEQRSSAGSPNTSVISDLSKAFSLPGLRLGWIIEPDAGRRARILDARSYFTLSGSPVLETLACHAIANREAILARTRNVATANLSKLMDFVYRNSDVIACVEPRGGTTAFPWLLDGRNVRSFCRTLAQAGVLVVPGDCFDQDDHFRVGLCSPVENFSRALDICSRVLRA